MAGGRKVPEVGNFQRPGLKVVKKKDPKSAGCKSTTGQNKEMQNVLDWMVAAATRKILNS